MKLGLILITMALTASGCYTAGQIREEGTRFEFVSKQAFGPAAQCVSRNAEEVSTSVAVQVKNTGVEPLEVILRTPDSVIATVEIRSVLPGANILVFVSPMTFSPQRVADALTKGCL